MLNLHCCIMAGACLDVSASAVVKGKKPLPTTQQALLQELHGGRIWLCWPYLGHDKSTGVSAEGSPACKKHFFNNILLVLSQHCCSQSYSF
jgi:hypothetical protein